MFSGLDTLKCKYSITLKDRTKQFCLAPPRRVPLLLQDAVKQKIMHMGDPRVITSVTDPTECIREYWRSHKITENFDFVLITCI